MPRLRLIKQFQLKVLNKLEFDCAQVNDDGDDCLQRTNAIRKTFAPLIEAATRCMLVV